MKIFIIASMDENRVIGNGGKMLWNLPNDIKKFKKHTINNIVIMGRKTFNSISNKPLPKRSNIIITTDKKYSLPGIETYNSLEKAFINCNKKNENKKIFVIGGGEIYKQAIKYASVLFLTIVHHKFTGKIKFPEISFKEWTRKNIFFNKKNNDNYYDYTYSTFVRIKNHTNIPTIIAER